MPLSPNVNVCVSPFAGAERCIRCRSETPSIFLTTQRGLTGFCLNLCEVCIAATIGGAASLRGKGDKIIEANQDTPKHCVVDLRKWSHRPDRELEIIPRSKYAKYHVNLGAKYRRNLNRFEEVKSRAMEFGVQDGELISRGFEEFDEYFGTLDDAGEPHGLGVKSFSDGSIYVGHWEHGLRHTVEKSLWQRPDGLQYEGTWVKDHKHGHGKQTYPDGSIYIGDWAKGYEHGFGKKTEKDGSLFEGRYRFGKRDGPGQLTHSDGKTIEKRVFRDPEVHYEQPIPEIVEVVPDNEAKFFEPLSLMALCIKAVGQTMHMHRPLASAQVLQKMLPEHMKPWIAEEYLLTMNPRGTADFLASAPLVAYKLQPEISLTAVKFAHFDCEALLYFISSNSQLRALQLTLNRLGPANLDMISKKLFNRTWPKLESLDLSFNKIDTSGMSNLINALKANPFLLNLRLSGCNLNSNSVKVIAKYLAENDTITDVDLSFNRMQVLGAEAMAACIQKNKSILRMNLRHNGLGNIGMCMINFMIISFHATIHFHLTYINLIIIVN